MAENINSIEVLLDVTGINIRNSVVGEINKIQAGGADAMVQKVMQAFNTTQLKQLGGGGAKINKATTEIVDALINLINEIKDIPRQAKAASTPFKSQADRNKAYDMATGAILNDKSGFFKNAGSLLAKRFSDQSRSDIDALSRDKKLLNSEISARFKQIDKILSDGFLSPQIQGQLKGLRNKLSTQQQSIGALAKAEPVGSNTTNAISSLIGKLDGIAKKAEYRDRIASTAKERAITSKGNADAIIKSQASTQAQKDSAYRQKQAAEQTLADIKRKQYSRAVYEFGSANRANAPVDERNSINASSRQIAPYNISQKAENNRRKADRQLRDAFNQTVAQGRDLLTKVQTLETRVSGYGVSANLGSSTIGAQVTQLNGNRSGFLANADSARRRVIGRRQAAGYRDFLTQTGLSGQEAKTRFLELVQKGGGKQKYFGVTTADILDELQAGGQSPNFKDGSILSGARRTAASLLVQRRQAGRNVKVDTASGISDARRAVRLLSSRGISDNADGFGQQITDITGRSSSFIDSLNRGGTAGLSPQQATQQRAQGAQLLREAQAVASQVEDNRRVVREAAILAQRTRAQIDAALRVSSTNRESIPASVHATLLSQRTEASTIIDNAGRPVSAATLAAARAYNTSGPAFTADQLANNLRGDYAAQQNRNRRGAIVSTGVRLEGQFGSATQRVERDINTRTSYVERLSRKAEQARAAGITNIPALPTFGLPALEQRATTLQTTTPAGLRALVEREKRAASSRLSAQAFQEFEREQTERYGPQDRRALGQQFGQRVRTAGGIFKYSGVNERDIERTAVQNATRIPGVDDAATAANTYGRMSRELSHVTTEARRANAEFAANQRQLRNLNVDARTFGDQIGLAVKRFAAFAIGTGGLFAVIGAARQAASEALKLEKAQTRLAQILGKDRKDVGPIVNNAARIATRTGTPATETLAGIDFLAQAGYQDQSQLIKTSELLSKVPLAATFGSVAETVDGLLALNSQFNKSLNDTENIFDTLNQVAGDYAVEVKDIFDAIKRGGSTFSEAGGDLKEYIKLVTLVRSSSRENAETIGNFFKSISFRLFKPANLKILKNIGVDTSGGIADILENTASRFSDKFGSGDQLKGNKQAVQLANKLAGTFQGGKFLTVLDAINKDDGRITGSFARSGGSFRTATDKALGDIGISLKRIEASLVEFSKTVIGSPLLRSGFKAAADVTSAISGASNVITPIVGAAALYGTLRGVPAFLRGSNAALRRTGIIGGGPQSLDQVYREMPQVMYGGVDVMRKARENRISGLPEHRGFFGRLASGRGITDNIVGVLSQLTPRNIIRAIGSPLQTIDSLFLNRTARTAEVRSEYYNAVEERRLRNQPPMTSAERSALVRNTRNQYRTNQRRRVLGGLGAVVSIGGGILAATNEQRALENLNTKDSLENRYAYNRAGLYSGLATTAGAAAMGFSIGGPYGAAALGLISAGSTAYNYVSGRNKIAREEQDIQASNKIGQLLRNKSFGGISDLIASISDKETKGNLSSSYLATKLKDPNLIKMRNKLVRQGNVDVVQAIKAELLKQDPKIFDNIGAGTAEEQITKTLDNKISQAGYTSSDLANLRSRRMIAIAENDAIASNSATGISKLYSRQSELGGFASNFGVGLERTNTLTDGYGFNRNMAAAQIAELNSAKRSYGTLSLNQNEKALLDQYRQNGKGGTLSDFANGNSISIDTSRIKQIENAAVIYANAVDKTLTEALADFSSGFTQQIDESLNKIDDANQAAFQRRLEMFQRSATIRRSTAASQESLIGESFGYVGQSAANNRARIQSSLSTRYLLGGSESDYLKAQLATGTRTNVFNNGSGLSALSGALGQNARDRIAADKAKDQEKLLSLQSAAVDLEIKYNAERSNAIRSLQLLDTNLSLVSDKFSLLQQQLEKQRAFQEGAAGTNTKATSRQKSILKTAQDKLNKPLGLAGDTISADEVTGIFAGMTDKELKAFADLLKDPRLKGLNTKSIGLNTNYNNEEFGRFVDQALGNRNIVGFVGDLVNTPGRRGTGNSARSQHNEQEMFKDRIRGALMDGLTKPADQMKDLEAERSKYLSQQNEILNALILSNQDQVNVLGEQRKAALELTSALNQAASSWNDVAQLNVFNDFARATARFDDYVKNMNGSGRIDIGIEPISININASSNIFDSFGKKLKDEVYAAITSALKGVAAGENVDVAAHDTSNDDMSVEDVTQAVISPRWK